MNSPSNKHDNIAGSYQHHSIQVHDPKISQAMQADEKIRTIRHALLEKSVAYRYSYNFTWLGIPLIQFPEDVLSLQEIVFETRPTLIIETGIAHGGSILFYASLLEIIGEGVVLGIELNMRDETREMLKTHPLSKRIEIVEGSSTDSPVSAYLRTRARENRVMVVLDSNHSHAHVLEELRLYAPIVSPNCYLVVMDTGIEFVPKSYFSDRPWGPGNNPWTAVHAFLKNDQNFEIDRTLLDRLILTACPDGYLRRKP